MIIRRNALTIAILTALAGTASASEAPANVEEMVVTGVRTDAPLNVSTNPKAPRQPVPAHDGADYLKTIPGFNVIRKGGTDGDPMFRGMAASRVNILLDGESLLGGCGMRMDPPTAYVFPEAYDRITVIKGPQSVTHGPGNSAATVMFERDSKRLEEAGWKGQRVGDRRQLRARRRGAARGRRHAAGICRADRHARAVRQLRGRQRQRGALALRAPERQRRARLDAGREHQPGTQRRAQRRRGSLRGPHDGRRRVRA
jgi:outer membrane receptor protein involved in Fe transport